MTKGGLLILERAAAVDAEVITKPPKRKRHKWSRDVVRLEFETVRTCIICGLKKVTQKYMHPPTVYYLDPKTRESFPVMPECEMVE